jgi:methylmalonyl-CoA epimerase
MTISGIDHVVLLVSDIEEGIRTWQQKLGLTLGHRVDLQSAGIQQAFFPMSDGTFIELVSPADEHSELSAILKTRGEGLQVLAMRVDDLQDTTEQLSKRGVKLVGAGTQQVFIHPKSAGGILIQLWPKERPHRWRDNPVVNAKPKLKEDNAHDV